MNGIFRDDGNLTGCIAGVVGGGSTRGKNIGDACSKTLAAYDAEVFILDISEEGAQQTELAIRASGGQAHSILTKATSKESVESAITQMVAQTGRIDILVLVVGKGGGNAPSMLDAERLQESIKRNLLSAVIPIQASLPYMGWGGAIVAVGSINGCTPSMVGEVEYALSKAALSLYIQSLAQEIAPRGIRANLVAPASVATSSQTIRARIEEYPDYFAGIGQMLYPLADDKQPVAMPQDVANAVYFLASSLSRFITGVELRVDGGFSGISPVFNRLGGDTNWVRNILKVYHLTQALTDHKP